MKLKKPNFEHNGIRAELHGVIGKYSKINSTITEFTNLGIEILRPGKIEATSSTIPFSFKNTKLEYESYKGLYAQARYYIKIIISTNMLNYTYEQEFCAVSPIDSVFLMEEDETIKMSVGLQNLLSLDFDLEHRNYNCRGTVKGIVSFNYIHLPIKYMEVQLLKNEVVFMDNNKHEPIIIDSYELIDGSPVKKDKIPFRLYLNSYSLTPTYRNVGNVFSVKYYVNLVVGDFENNTFFKQTEIKLFRVFKTKKNPDLNYGPFEEFISEPVYNEEYYNETDIKNKNEINKTKNEINKNKNLNVFSNEEEEDEEEEEEEDDNEEDEKDNDCIIDTTSAENKEKNKKKKKKEKRNSGIVNILRSNSLYKSEKFEKKKNIINNNNIDNGNDNNNIIIPFNDDDDNNYMNTLITTNFPSQSNNQLFNNESNSINNINEIITNSINNSKYGKIIKFDD